MELFVLDEESGEVNLNKIWIRNNPKLSALFDRDKGNRGVRTDYSAVKKEKAKRDLEIQQLMLEIKMIETETVKNKKVIDKIDKFLND